jgi:hypothetical protein
MINLLGVILAILGFSQSIGPGECLNYLDNLGIPMVVCMELSQVNPADCEVSTYLFPQSVSNLLGVETIQSRTYLFENDTQPRLRCMRTVPARLRVVTENKSLYYTQFIPLSVK